MDMKRVALGTLLTIATGLLPTLAVAQPASSVKFYEGRAGNLGNFCTVNIDQSPFKKKSSFADHGCANDKAKSMILDRLKKGSVVKVYKDPKCGTDGDWTEVTVKNATSAITIESFERTADTAEYAQAYHGDSGLDGRASCFDIDAK